MAALITPPDSLIGSFATLSREVSECITSVESCFGVWREVGKGWEGQLEVMEVEVVFFFNPSKTWIETFHSCCWQRKACVNVDLGAARAADSAVLDEVDPVVTFRTRRPAGR